MWIRYPRIGIHAASHDYACLINSYLCAMMVPSLWYKDIWICNMVLYLLQVLSIHTCTHVTVKCEYYIRYMACTRIWLELCLEFIFWTGVLWHIHVQCICYATLHMIPIAFVAHRTTCCWCIALCSPSKGKKQKGLAGYWFCDTIGTAERESIVTSMLV